MPTGASIRWFVILGSVALNNVAATQDYIPAFPPRPPAEQTAPVAQRAAMLIQAAVNDKQNIETLVGTTVWRFEESRRPGGASLPALRADVDIPSAAMRMVFLVEKNNDPTLRASHILTFRFIPQEGSRLPAIAEMGAPQMRNESAPSVDTLAGAQAKMLDQNYIVALSADANFAARNLETMRTRGWFDFPIRFSDGRIGKITIEKGAPGDQLLNHAIEQWQRAIRPVNESATSNTAERRASENAPAVVKPGPATGAATQRLPTAGPAANKFFPEPRSVPTIAVDPRATTNSQRNLDIKPQGADVAEAPKVEVPRAPGGSPSSSPSPRRFNPNEIFEQLSKKPKLDWASLDRLTVLQLQQCLKGIKPSKQPYVPEYEVTYSPDGLLQSVRLRNRPNDPDRLRVATATMNALTNPKCNPLRIPDQFKPHYAQWKDRIFRFDLTRARKVSGRTFTADQKTTAAASSSAASKMMPASAWRELDEQLFNQYKDCWHVTPEDPALPYVPQIEVSFTNAGELTRLPRVRNESDLPAHKVLAEAALQTVRRCNPIKIDPKFLPYHNEWKNRILRFDPRELNP